MSRKPAWGARSILLIAMVTVVFTANRDAAIADAEMEPESLRTCKVCHDLSADKLSTGRIGPPLWDIGNRSIGSYTGFNGYSETLASMGNNGKIWDRRTLERYLEDPRQFAPGSRMAFTGIIDEEKRMKAVDYLFTLRN
ncbi:c-type cytochrome [Magnetococcus sp. PR-3]|uniref:c-type cytochrome n=1 Tax=Magnetococcus sp. PR-3 TaxID=3120355 RepID=UPI002FCE5CDA